MTRQWNDNFYPAGDPRPGNFIADCDLTSPILSQNNTFGSSWLTPTQILAARLFKIGIQANF